MRALLALALVLALLPAPAAQALPTPGLYCEEGLAATGRLFPEAMQTNDFVSLADAECGLRWLEAQHGDLIEVLEVGRSHGWTSLTGARTTFPVYAVEVTNEKSATPREEKAQLLFQLSIHGNEKGGREGGLRVIEDLVRGIGLARSSPELVALLDAQLLVFTFPNPDGWVHEELEYRLDGRTPLNYVRENGNAKDLNRQWPTVGWMRDSHSPLSEPEIVAMHAYLTSFTNWKYATDIHGMLTPADGRYHVKPVDERLGGGPESDEPRSHFLLTMVAAGRQDPDETRRITELSERIKTRVNANPEFAPWTSVPATGAWGGNANEWGMSVDAIGYEDSGFTGDFFTQDHGLNVPDIDFELSYNHITFDNYYPGIGQLINKMSIAAVRDIVASMMEMGAEDLRTVVRSDGHRVLVVENPVVLASSGARATGGWAKENPLDDAFETRAWRAAPVDYWHDLRAHLDDPSALDIVPGAAFPTRDLGRYDHVVVPGTAWTTLAPDAVSALRAWTEAGGTLVLTDSALQLAVTLGALPAGSVAETITYTGHVDVTDRTHPLVEGVRGLARQTYVAVPLGYAVDKDSAPVWHAKADLVTVVGVVDRDPARASLATVPLGSGTIVLFGAALPDPTDAHHHPYGLDSHAVTYTASRILRNALGFGEDLLPTSEAEALRLDAAATASPASVPAAPLALALGLVALVAWARRR